MGQLLVPSYHQNPPQEVRPVLLSTKTLARATNYHPQSRLLKKPSELENSTQVYLRLFVVVYACLIRVLVLPHPHPVETESFSVAQDTLSCFLSLLGAGITGVCHYVWLQLEFGSG